jgi:hypothetical protein
LPDGSGNASDAVLTAKLRVDLRPVDECHQSHFELDCATSRTGKIENLARVITNGHVTKGCNAKNEAVGLKLVKYAVDQAIAAAEFGSAIVHLSTSSDTVIFFGFRRTTRVSEMPAASKH